MLGTVEQLARCVEEDLAALFPAMYKSPRGQSVQKKSRSKVA